MNHTLTNDHNAEFGLFSYRNEAIREAVKLLLLDATNDHDLTPAIMIKATSPHHARVSRIHTTTGTTTPQITHLHITPDTEPTTEPAQ